MGKIICISNQKGGVGKTTTTINLSAALASMGKKVLVIDMDPQGNASSGVGLGPDDKKKKNIYYSLVGQKSIAEMTCNTKEFGLNIVPASPDLVGAELELVGAMGREFKLQKALESVLPSYDYIFIDCPPSLGLLTVNSLTAAHSFLVPLQCEYYALEGLSQLLNTVGLIKKHLNPALELEGIVLTMFDKRNNLSHQVVSEIQSHFKDKVFSVIIPRNIKLSEAPSHGQSVHSYDERSIGAQKYRALAEELSGEQPVRAEDEVSKPDEACDPASRPIEPNAETMEASLTAANVDSLDLKPVAKPLPIAEVENQPTQQGGHSYAQ